PDRPGTRGSAAAHRSAPTGSAGHRRSGSHPGHPRRGALALDRPHPVALGGVPPLHRQADAEPRAAGHELSQALGPSAPSREERGGGGRFSKDFPARLEEIRQAVGGKPLEIWFPDEARIGQKNKITRTKSRGAGPNAPPARQPPRTQGPPRPTSSGLSARLRARARAWFCPAAPPRA